MNTIRLFVWGYQQHFQISANRAAEELFNKLNPEFVADVFLLALRRTDDPEKHLVCLEPEDCGFRPSDFESLREDAEHRYALDPERNLMTTVQSHYDAIQARAKQRAMREAALSVLNDWHHTKQGECFLLGFLPVADHDVAVVLRVTYPEQHRPYRIPKVHADRRYSSPASFLDAVAEEFLRECSKALHVPRPEMVAEMRERPPEELLRSAGNRMMETPVWAARNIVGLYGLFDACNVIASQTYEKAESLGGMLVSRDKHPNVNRELTLVSPAPLTSRRQVRKMLQMAGSHMQLICDGAQILGFGRTIGNYDQGNADLFEVRFIGHHRWELCHGDHRVMRCHYGTPMLPLPPLNEVKLKSDLQRVFRSAAAPAIERLAALAMQACQQRKGALLVISEAAESEAKRLAAQSTPIAPRLLTPELVGHLTSIDGALLLTPEGVCHAVGAILDGMATAEGDPARGARYNSCVRYLVQQAAPCAAIIVSEDGSAEWLPYLHPQIRRKDLAAHETQVKALLEAQELDQDKAWKELGWLRDHRFYMSADLCAAANKLDERVREARMKEGAIVVQYAPFQPDSAMTDEYLLDGQN